MKKSRLKIFSKSPKFQEEPFYRHFTNKQELLNYYFEKVIDDYLKERQNFARSESFEVMVAGSLEFWYHKRNVLSILIKHQHFDLFSTNSTDVPKKPITALLSLGLHTAVM